MSIIPKARFEIRFFEAKLNPSFSLEAVYEQRFADYSSEPDHEWGKQYDVCTKSYKRDDFLTQ